MRTFQLGAAWRSVGFASRARRASCRSDCFSLVGLCVLWACGAAAFGQALVGERVVRATEESLVGEWASEIGKSKVRLRLARDGQASLDGANGRYSVHGNKLEIRLGERSTVYQFDLAADQLTLSGGDLAQPAKFARLPEVGGYLSWISGLSPRSAKTKLYRILTIAIIVITARVLILALRALSRFVVFTDWGPLGLVYRERKNRTLTIHSLVLNLCKYVVYFAALGMILAELGVNYTAYLASLSVLGLAIAFGSQGFIQDMVTGFFVIFEAQYDVGDMVEISGQTGIVEELGLRMTRLRNFLSQIVVIPNRNIAVVGNYTKGALQTYIDAAVSSRDVARHAGEVLEQIGGEIGRQFDGVVLTEPRVLGPVSLATGEHFVRLHLAIWPGQQWVVDQQLVPRIREVLKTRGFEIPADRVVAFYRTGEELEAPSWSKPLEAIRKRFQRTEGPEPKPEDEKPHEMEEHEAGQTPEQTSQGSAPDGHPPRHRGGRRRRRKR